MLRNTLKLVSKSCARYSLAVLLGVAITWAGIVIAAPSSKPFANFSNWKDRPRHPFTNGAKHFAQVMKLLRSHHLNAQFDDDTLYKAAVQGMLQLANPKEARWNKLISPTELAEMQVSLHSRVAGIGIQMKFNAATGTSLVLGIIPHSPAQKAGLRKGDRILKVNDVFYKGKNIRDVVYAIRGKIGTVVKLTVLRDAQISTYTLTRSKVSFSPVQGWMLPKGAGYIKINYFAYATPSLLGKELKRLAQQQARGLIIDLRANGGGALKSAIASADLLLPKGKLIASLRARARKMTPFVSQQDGLLPDTKGRKLQIYVLIDRHTSSGAELFAAALKAHRHATLIGDRTFGKWNVQKIAKLANGYAVKYTIGRFLDPHNKHYHRKGLQPDIRIPSKKALDHHRPIQDIKAQMAQDAALQVAYTLFGNR